MKYLVVNGANNSSVRLKVLFEAGCWAVTERVSVLRSFKDEPLNDDRLALTHVPSGRKLCCGTLRALSKLASALDGAGLRHDALERREDITRLLADHKSRYVARKDRLSDRERWVGTVPSDWRAL